MEQDDGGRNHAILLHRAVVQGKEKAVCLTSPFLLLSDRKHIAVNYF